MKRYASRATKLLAIATLICGAVVLIGIIIAVAGVSCFLIAVHDCRGHGKEKDCHADDRRNDFCDSFPNAVSLPRRDSGTV